MWYNRLYVNFIQERQERMSSNNWEKFGEEIRKTVQDAVEHQDYEKLNQAISKTINQAVDAVANGVKNAANTTQAKYHGYKTYTTDFEKAKRTQETKTAPAKIETKVPSKAGTLIAAVLGYTFGGFQFFIFIAMLLALFTVDDSFVLGARIVGGICSAIAGGLSVLGIGVGIRATKNFTRIERFADYIATIGRREYCNISDLVKRVGKSEKTVVKDIEYMIKKRWFLQGHLDKQKTCLMVTDKMYDQYCQLEEQKQLEQKEIQQKEAQKQEQQRKEWEDKEAHRKSLSPEVQKVIMQGEEYIQKIRKCNDDIPGEEISAKIDRIEMLVDKIFDRVEQNPKSVSDIRKLMDYYLPTTVKLLEAYAEMDAQPAGGENIQTAKKEIEATLDTLNVAFEKLLDSLFQEAAWDVSSDISVLNTMLAQEGLKEDGLKRK